jgi:hypothetical protein
MFSPDQLATALDAVADRWSLPSTFKSTGVHHGYRQTIVVTAGVLRVPGLTWLVAPFAPVAEAWFSSIDPGGFIVDHVDAGPYRERWQVPFTPAGQLLHDREPVAHEVGVPFRVRQYEWHSVENHTDEARVVLVVDRDVLIGVPAGPFRVR